MFFFLTLHLELAFGIMAGVIDEKAKLRGNNKRKGEVEVVVAVDVQLEDATLTEKSEIERSEQQGRLDLHDLENPDAIISEAEQREIDAHVEKKRKRANDRAYNMRRPDPTSDWNRKKLGFAMRAKSPDQKTRIYFFAGGDNSNPMLERLYKDLPKPKYRKWLGFIVKLALKEKLYKRGGNDMDSLAPFQGCSFLVAEGVYFSFTFRAWGDLCQAIEGEHKRGKGLVDFVNQGYLAFYP